MKLLFRFFAAALLLAAGHAQAAYTAYMYESGGNVIVSGSGTLNLTGLALTSIGTAVSRVQPNNGALVVGATPGTLAYEPITGPLSYGPGPNLTTVITQGDKVAVAPSFSNRLLVPNPYVSGAPLSSTSTWVGTTIAGLGATPGSYTWTWAGDSFTLHVAFPPGARVAAVPTLSEWGMVLLSMALALFGAIRMRRPSLSSPGLSSRT